MILAFWLIATSWAAERGWTVAETPSWVIAQEIPDGAHAQEDQGGGVQILLDDEQVDIGEGRETHYYRDVLRVASVAGIQDYSEVSFTFDPSYETVALHHITILRGGQEIDALMPGELRVVQRERDMDLRIYNGELQILAFLNDVRQGDVIDTAWSVSGANPALDGHYVDSLGMELALPVARLHRRLRLPEDRTLFIRAHQGAPEVLEGREDGHAVYTWTREHVPAARWDSGAPGWVEQRSWVQVSDFGSWAEVVNWALPHYQAGALGDSLREAIAAWSASPEAEIRLGSALEFVQDDVRYLGIEMGPRALIPHGVAETFARRFGDCKDKSLLLVAALEEMGIEAHPALVHTRRRRGIRGLRPTAYAFNHAIVQVRLDGQTLWLDPTRSYERGRLSNMSPVDFEVALVLEPGGDGLTEIVSQVADTPQVETLEHFAVEERYGPVSLEVETHYRGRYASAIRRQLESELVEDVRAARLRAYMERYPGTVAVGALGVRDDPASGTLTLSERYRLPGLWHDGAFGLVGLEALRGLTVPPAGARNFPLAIPHPTLRRHVVALDLPVAYVLRDGSDRVQSDAFEFEAVRTYQGGVLRVESTYRSLMDHVPVDALAAYRASTEAAQELGVYWVFDGELARGMDRTVVGAVVGISFVVFLFLVGPIRNVGSRWLRHRAFASRLRAQVPDSPSTALKVDDTSQANRALKSMPCACGAPLDQGVPKASNLRHEGVHLLLLEAGCSQCERRTTAYFCFRL